MFVGLAEISSRLDGQTEFQMFPLFFQPPCWWSNQYDCSKLGSVNLRKTFRRISEVWENTETYNITIS